MKSFSLPFMPLLLAMLAFISGITWYISHSFGLTLAYSDSMSHINLARLVIDNRQPGLAQIGGVWLPLNHILTLPFVWHDWLWATGLAGSLVSMGAYVAASVGIYLIVMHITSSRWASWVGLLAWSLNFNLLYLQTTALTETLYLATFVWTVWAFIKWLENFSPGYLLTMGWLGFLQVLTRYDGWFVVMVQAILIIAALYVEKIKQPGKIIGKVILYSFPIAIGVGLWLLWNALIFNDIFYFMHGPFSARAQQQVIEANSGLLTKGSWWWSGLVYGYSIIENVGPWVLILSAMGSVLFIYNIKILPLYSKHKKSSNMSRLKIFSFKTKNKISIIHAKRYKSLKIQHKLILLCLLITPVAFNLISLFFGFSLLNMPQLGWQLSDNTGQWFNVRYGLLALPVVAIALGLLSNTKSKIDGFLILFIMIMQQLLLLNNGLVTVMDGTQGMSSFRHHAISDELHELVANEQSVLLSMSYFNPVAFRSGLPLKQFIHEGVELQWYPSLENPQRYAEWIVMADGDTIDPVYKALIVDRNADFEQYYTLVFQGNGGRVYKFGK